MVKAKRPDAQRYFTDFETHPETEEDEPVDIMDLPFEQFVAALRKKYPGRKYPNLNDPPASDERSAEPPPAIKPRRNKGNKSCTRSTNPDQATVESIL